MFVQVRASNPPHAGTFTPGRFWPNSVTRRLEVVEDDVAARQLGAPGPKTDPAVRKLEIASGPFLSDGQPDPERITKSGLEHVRGNQHLSVLGDEETQGTMTQAAVDAARAEVARLNADLTDAKIYAAELEAEVEKLTRLNADLTARAADLEKAVAEAKATGKKPKDEKSKDDKPAEGEAK